MSVRQKNLIWASLMAVAFYVYYTIIARYWLGQDVIDPLAANLIAFPFLLGLVCSVGLSGALTEKIIFLVLVTVVPGLIAFREGDPAKPGLQWLLLIVLHLPYLIGALVGWGSQHLVGKFWAKRNGT